MQKIIYLCIIACILYNSCDKDSKQLTSSNTPPVVTTDTFSLENPGGGNCNSGFGIDTCFFQRIGDTIRIYGNVIMQCGYSTVIMTEKNDSILINWCPLNGPICDMVVVGCFDLKIPHATNYSIVKFLGKTYKGF